MYECPLKQRTKWHVHNFLTRWQQQVLRRWMKEVETLSDTEEEMVCICEPEIGENLNDEEKRSMEDLMRFQEGSDEGSISRWEMR
jgi:hypothetical protein